MEKDYSKYIEIASIISMNDAKVVKNVSEYIKDLLDNNRTYATEENDKNVVKIIWMGLANILIENGCVDKDLYLKSGLYSFVDNISKILSFAGIEEDEDLDCFDEDDENGCIASWARALDNDPVMQGFVIGCYDIGADCYDFFVCTKEELETLSKLAEEIGHRICRCSEC